MTTYSGIIFRKVNFPLKSKMPYLWPSPWVLGAGKPQPQTPWSLAEPSRWDGRNKQSPPLPRLPTPVHTNHWRAGREMEQNLRQLPERISVHQARTLGAQEPASVWPLLGSAGRVWPVTHKPTGWDRTVWNDVTILCAALPLGKNMQWIFSPDPLNSQGCWHDGLIDGCVQRCYI